MIELFQREVASGMDEYRLIISLMQALEGEEVQRERALALVYELRDRSKSFNTEQ